jgi:hypothetical protein
MNSSFRWAIMLGLGACLVYVLLKQPEIIWEPQFDRPPQPPAG